MVTKLPNLLTISRIAVIPILIGVLMFVSDPAGSWVAFAIYVYACITDFFDGYLAREMQQESTLGMFLDPIADKLLVASVLLTLMGKAGLVSALGLGKVRKYAVVSILLVAAIVTPPDVITQIILFAVVYTLYELSIFMVKLVENQRDKEADTPTDSV